LNGLHFLLKLGEISVQAARRRNLLGKAKQLSQADERLQHLKAVDARAGLSLSTVLSLLLIGVSVANAVYLFTQKRSYQLALCEDKLKSPNASMVDQEEAMSVPPSLWTQLMRVALLPSGPTDFGAATWSRRVANPRIKSSS
jgi:hypothetical protein